MKIKKCILGIVCFCLSFFNLRLQIHAEEPSSQGDIVLGETGGYLAGNFVATNNLNAQTKFTYNTGFGFAAEQANNFSDRLHLKNAKVVGANNFKDGADRVIQDHAGNKTFIQDKYYKTASGSVNAAFNQDTGEYRYINADGSCMKLEVPKGQGAEAIKTMEQKISDGAVPGVTDPNEAKNIIQEGSYTYDQVVNISKAGNIDSLVYDAEIGVVSSASAMGISFVLTFSSCMIPSLTVG